MSSIDLTLCGGATVYHSSRADDLVSHRIETVWGSSVRSSCDLSHRPVIEVAVSTPHRGTPRTRGGVEWAVNSKASSSYGCSSSEPSKPRNTSRRSLSFHCNTGYIERDCEDPAESASAGPG